jgi:hypothetical protein
LPRRCPTCTAVDFDSTGTEGLFSLAAPVVPGLLFSPVDPFCTKGLLSPVVPRGVTELFSPVDPIGVTELLSTVDPASHEDLFSPACPCGIGQVEIILSSVLGVSSLEACFTCTGSMILAEVLTAVLF